MLLQLQWQCTFLTPACTKAMISSFLGKGLLNQSVTSGRLVMKNSLSVLLYQRTLFSANQAYIQVADRSLRKEIFTVGDPAIRKASVHQGYIVMYYLKGRGERLLNQSEYRPENHSLANFGKTKL